MTRVMNHESPSEDWPLTRGSFSEADHQQLWQMIHDIHNADAVVSQHALDEVLIGAGHLSAVAVMANMSLYLEERQQRRQANEATYLSTEHANTMNGVPILLVIWARKMHENGDQWWVRRASGEVITMCLVACSRASDMDGTSNTAKTSR